MPRLEELFDDERPGDTLPGLGRTATEAQKLVHKWGRFNKLEENCPNCCPDNPQDTTVTWCELGKQFRCTRCKWVDTRRTAEGRRLKEQLAEV